MNSIFPDFENMNGCGYLNPKKVSSHNNAVKDVLTISINERFPWLTNSSES